MSKKVLFALLVLGFATAHAGKVIPLNSTDAPAANTTTGFEALPLEVNAHIVQKLDSNDFNRHRGALQLNIEGHCDTRMPTQFRSIPRNVDFRQILAAPARKQEKG